MLRGSQQDIEASIKDILCQFMKSGENRNKKFTFEELYARVREEGCTKTQIKQMLKHYNFVYEQEQRYKYNHMYADITDQASLLQFFTAKGHFGVIRPYNDAAKKDDFMQAYDTHKMNQDLNQLVEQKKIRKYDKQRTQGDRPQFTVYFPVQRGIDPDDLMNSIPEEYRASTTDNLENSWLKSVCREVATQKEKEQSKTPEEGAPAGGRTRQRRRNHKITRNFQNRFLLDENPEFAKQWEKFQQENN